VARAESPPGILHAFIYVNDRSVAKSDNLSFTSDEASILNFGADAECNRRKIDISRLGETPLRLLGAVASSFHLEFN
jgi:hypothetical protein